MYREQVIVRTGEILQARGARSLTRLACQFRAQSWIDDGRQRVDAKSMIGVLSLDIFPENRLTLLADGGDERSAVQAMAGFFTGI